ncbi:hypothetical protein OQA88_2491 [Cercophora sp. LCS_1]
MSYKPSGIKPGVYSHINFAFAHLDPATFAIVPADPGDVALYRQVTDMKGDDPNLKVYIALGGWDHDGPWNPTARAFSRLVASEANQQAFFTSLISFMSTYNFDGIDIDWEYPVAEERAGDPADFENFTSFVANLRSALDSSSGGRNGITMTLPVAYWYLRHFDIVNAWITYDDLQTFQLKAKFAESQCLGGVMVWAISEDAGQTYANQLQAATGYRSPGVKWNQLEQKQEANPDYSINRNQCRWTSCGESCGPDYYPVFRKDWDRHSDGEYMFDPTGCKDGHKYLLCCPAYGPHPSCGWYGFWNGGCTGVCEGGQTQVGSLSDACHTGKPQAACCSTPKYNGVGVMRAVALYENCHWEGDHGGCQFTESSQCNDGTKLVASRMGSGADWCYRASSLCYWQKKEPDSSGYCHPKCPYGEVRVAMETTPPGCSSGGWAYCCTPVYKTEPDGSSQDWEALCEAVVSKFMETGNCGSSAGPIIFSPISRRDIDAFTHNASHHGEFETSLALRQMPGQVIGRPQAQATFLDTIARLLVAEDLPVAARVAFTVAMAAHWASEAVLNPNYLWVSTENMLRFARRWQGEQRRTVVRVNFCSMCLFARDAKETEGFTKGLQCDYIWREDAEFLHDGDNGGSEISDFLPNKRRRRQARGPVPPWEGEPPLPDGNGNWPEVAADGSVYPYEEVYNELYRRARAPRGPTPTFTVRPSPYPNGNEGLDLQLSNGDQSRYLVKSNGRGPDDYELKDDANVNDAKGKWVSEHILELQAIPRFLESAITGKHPIPKVFGTGSTRTIARSGQALVHPNIGLTTLPGWTHSESPIVWAMAQLGSVANPFNMVVCESALNAIKSRLFRFYVPITNKNWDNCCVHTTKASAERMFSTLQRVFAVFDYYRDSNVAAKHKSAYDQVKGVLAEFEATDPRFTSQELQSAWKQYCIYQAQYMGTHAEDWAKKKIDDMIDIWEAREKSISGSPGAAAQTYARMTILGLKGFRTKLNNGHLGISQNIFT